LNYFAPIYVNFKHVNVPQDSLLSASSTKRTVLIDLNLLKIFIVLTVYSFPFYLCDRLHLPISNLMIASK